MAVVSLITGLSFFFGIPIIGSLIAIITGNSAMKEIKNSNGMVIGENFARIGIITGWFGIGVWVLGLMCGFLALIFGLVPVISSVCVAMFPFLSDLLKSFH